VIALGTPDELKKSLGRDHLVGLESSDLLASMNLVRKLPGVADVAVFGGGLHVTVEDAARALPLIRPALEQAGIQVTRLEAIDPSLEDVFVAMIEREEKRAA
jgi:ABC-2 type transport system ATP-binding protein